MKFRILGISVLLASLGLIAPINAEQREQYLQLLQTKECRSCDLVNSDLARADLREADLRYANL
ncbi:pentapeptide repeat-containing protein, partial [Moorena sp. SIO3B2]